MAELLPEAFLYLCENEAVFVDALQPDIPSVRNSFIALIIEGQDRGELAGGKPDLVADMFIGVLCGVALSWVHGQRGAHLSDHIAHVADGCWRMLAP